MKFHFYRIKINSKHIYRLLNCCRNNEIRDVEIDKDYAGFSINYNQYSDLEKILKENNVQLIAPGHNISKEIISMFEVNYVLKHEFKDGNKKTVVVEQEFRTEDSLKNMNFDTIDGNQQKLF